MADQRIANFRSSDSFRDFCSLPDAADDVGDFPNCSSSIDNDGDVRSAYAGSIDYGDSSDEVAASRCESRERKRRWCVLGGLVIAAVAIVGTFQIISIVGATNTDVATISSDPSRTGRPVPHASDAASRDVTEATAPGRAAVRHDAVASDVRAKQSEPSLYCFVVMLPFGNELKLVKMQYEKGLSIFGCDEHAVFSNVTMPLGPKHDDGEDTVAFGGGTMQVKFNTWTWKNAGNNHLALNTGVFIRAWKEVFLQGKWQKHDWIVKVDPDTVFIPSRLRYLLRTRTLLPKARSITNTSSCSKCLLPDDEKTCMEHVEFEQSQGFSCPEALQRVARPPPAACGCDCGVDACHRPQSVYLRNCECNKYHPWDTMTNHALHGPLEVLSQSAAHDLEWGLSKCEKQLADSFDQWGEDWFLEQCLLSLGVNPLDSFSSLKDHDCSTIAWPCTQPHAAFQPFKSPYQYLQCNENAVKKGKWPPTEPQYLEHKYVSPISHMIVVAPQVRRLVKNGSKMLTN